jgi:hypothetical protein
MRALFRLPRPPWQQPRSGRSCQGANRRGVGTNDGKGPARTRALPQGEILARYEGPGTLAGVSEAGGDRDIARRRPNITTAPNDATRVTVAIPRLTPYRAGQTLAFLLVTTASGILSHDWLMIGREEPWITPPSELQVDKDGQSRSDTAGKKLYSPLIEFRDARTAARFKQQILEAIRRQRPEVLDGGMT